MEEMILEELSKLGVGKLNVKSIKKLKKEAREEIELNTLKKHRCKQK